MKFILLILIILLNFYIPIYPQKISKINALNTFSDNIHFENADQLFRLEKYDKAIELFNEYLEVFPYGLHRKEVYKKIAEIYFKEFEYVKSIKYYKSLYEEFNTSEDGIEAYFMCGICYQKMGFLNNAGEIFRTIMNEHPESNYAYQSKIKLDLIEILRNS